MLAVLLNLRALAQDDGLPNDGRINRVHHFGGDALYCVDRNYIPTHQYADFGQGGIRLLDIRGQERWFVPAAVIHAATELALQTGQGQLVATGQGTYGPVNLWTYTQPNGDIFFIFNGVDEYGKPNSMEFKFCLPIGPIPPEEDEPDEEDEPVSTSTRQRGPTSTPTNTPTDSLADTPTDTPTNTPTDTPTDTPG